MAELPPHVKAQADKVMAEHGTKSATATNAEKAEQTSKSFEASRTAEHLEKTTAQIKQDIAKTPNKE